MALAQHFIANNGFNPVNLPLANNVSAEDTLLEKEAFPGELASLRAQLSKSHVTQQKLFDANFQHQQHQQAKDTQMADQLIEMMPTGLVMLDGNGVLLKSIKWRALYSMNLF